MTILITGGTGLIGKELCQYLTDEKIIVLTRDPARAKKLINRPVHLISDLKEVDFNNIDVVINLAGEPIADKRWSASQKTKILQSRLSITRSIVDAINSSNTPPHTFISGSAIGFYGKQANDTLITEEFTNIHHEFSHSICKQWEEEALKANSNTRVCLLRTGIVLSRNGGALSKMLPAFKACLGGPIASGQQMMSWIHIDDMVNAILFLISESKLQGIFNITAPNPVNNYEFSKQLGKSLNRPTLFPMPKLILRILFGEMSELLVNGQAVVPSKLEKNGFVFKFPLLNTALDNVIKN